MASFPVHVTTSAILGCAVGAAGAYYFHYDWGPIFLAAGLTTVGGMLPDLDSDSGIPVRELFGLAGAIVPLLLLERLKRVGLMPEQVLVIMAGAYLLVRYGLSRIFKRVTVHRGMFHSVPALLIAGLAVFLMHTSEQQVPADEWRKRGYYAVGTMIGFLSHLVLDEIYAVDLMGVVPKLNQFAGSALKLTSKSWPATLLTYAILLALGSLAWVSMGKPSWESITSAASSRPATSAVAR
jgi:LexA-binding, inner membrane-associated putative hydrolase